MRSRNSVSLIDAHSRYKQKSLFNIEKGLFLLTDFDRVVRFFNALLTLEIFDA